MKMMFEYTETTVTHDGVVEDTYHSEPEHGTADAFLDGVYAQAQKPRTIVVQSGNALMIVTPESSTLVQAEDLTPPTEEG